MMEPPYAGTTMV